MERVVNARYWCITHVSSFHPFRPTLRPRRPLNDFYHPALEVSAGPLGEAEECCTSRLLLPLADKHRPWHGEHHGFVTSSFDEANAVRSLVGISAGMEGRLFTLAMKMPENIPGGTSVIGRGARGSVRRQ